MNRSQSGLTLLELLLSLAMLSAMVALLTTWLTMAIRSSRGTSEDVAHTAALQQAASVLQEDFNSAWPGSIAVYTDSTGRESVTLTTPHQPGPRFDEPAEWSEVRWGLASDLTSIERSCTRLTEFGDRSSLTTRVVLPNTSGLRCILHERDGEYEQTLLEVQLMKEGQTASAFASITVDTRRAREGHR